MSSMHVKVSMNFLTRAMSTKYVESDAWKMYGTEFKWVCSNGF